MKKKCTFSKNKDDHKIIRNDDLVVCECGKYKLTKEEFKELKKYKLTHGNL